MRHILLLFVIGACSFFQTTTAQSQAKTCKKNALQAIRISQQEEASEAIACWLTEGCQSAKDSLEAFTIIGNAFYQASSSAAEDSIAHVYLDHAIDLNLKDELFTAYAFRIKGRLYEGPVPEESIEHYQIAISIFQKLNNEKGIASCINALGDIYGGQGEYERAIFYYKRAANYYLLEIQKNYDPKTAGYAVDRLSDLCIAYRSQGRHEEAVIYGDSAVKVAGFMPSDFPLKDSYLAQALIFLAEAQYHLPAYEIGLTNCQSALELLKETRNEDWQRANRVAAICAHALKDHKQAESYFLSALHIQSKSYDSRELSKAHLAYVKFLVDRGEAAKVEEYLKKGEQLVLDTTQPNQSENLLFRIRAQKGKVYRELYKDHHSPAYLQKSFEAYQQMMEAEKNYLDKLLYESSLLEEVKRSHKRREGLLETAFYLSTAENDLATASVEIAWKSSEERKGVVLWGNLHALNKANRFLPDSALEKMNLLKKKQDAASLAKLAILQEQLLDSFPAYRQAQQSKIPISLQEVQNHLTKNQALIAYFYGEDYIFAFFVPHCGKAELHQWETSACESRLKKLLKSLNPGQSPDPTDPILAHTLYQQLLGNFTQPLPKNLIIIPDGPLNYLPFEILLTQAPDTSELEPSFWKGKSKKRPNGATYLLLDHEIQYAHSATLLFAESKPKPAGQMAVFAPAYLEGDSFQSRRILPLAGMEAHAQNLNQSMDCRLFTGSHAGVGQFLSQAPTYRMLHLALHGFADEQEPLKAALAFSSTESSSGILTAAQLYGLPPLQAELVSLLSCETGAGQYARGEGVMSLARAFRYAGANSVLMSLWQADIGSGKFIMERFYKHLQHGETKGAALRLAKLDWLEDAKTAQAYPGRWANFVLVGDAAPITPQPARTWVWYLSGAILLLVLATMWWRRKR